MSVFYINKAFLAGNLVENPKLIELQDKNLMLAFTMVTNHDVKRGDKWEQVGTFHKIVFFGKVSKWLSENLKKGSKVFVEGRINTRTYKDKEGKEQRSREIVANAITPGGSFGKAENKKPEDQEDQQQGRPDGSEEVSDDDIPF